MNSYRKTAIIVGVLFIIGTVAGVLSFVVTRSILGDSDYLIKISANENQIIIGAILVLIMGFVLAMVPVMLFPIFRKYNEPLAIGAIVFRGALEAVAYITIGIKSGICKSGSYGCILFSDFRYCINGRRSLD